MEHAATSSPSLSLSSEPATPVGTAPVLVGVPAEAGDEGPRSAGPTLHSLGSFSPLSRTPKLLFVCLGRDHLREVVLKPLEEF